MKYVILVPIATFLIGFWALWVTSGMRLRESERELCWALPSCEKL